ncbi:MAG TPA: aminoacyl-tRNA hydrolase [Kineosporiaceae bacterium]|nr:aminoacyl-tRNA hydrolase [Kineosporiaceae bacterium]
MDQPWLVVGLGNPGERYARNRHNAGYQVVDQLAAEIGGKFSSHRSRAAVLEGRLPPVAGQPGPRLVLAKPSVFMNESGGPVAGLINFYRVPIDQLIIIHDELDLPFGVLRLKQGGGEGGHNGLRSISRSTDSKNYLRVRVGIGRPPGRMDPADYVLKDVPAADREEFRLVVGEAADAVTSIAMSGFAATQGRVNAIG